LLVSLKVLGCNEVKGFVRLGVSQELTDSSNRERRGKPALRTKHSNDHYEGDNQVTKDEYYARDERWDVFPEVDVIFVGFEFDHIDRKVMW
jgi:hypothetical protein